MNSKIIADENENHRSSTVENEEFDFKSLENLSDEEVQHKITNYDDIESLKNYIDRSYGLPIDFSTRNQPISDTHYPDDYDALSTQKALSNMTTEDLDQFFNAYQVITSSSPNIDETISKASIEQILSGKLLDGEYVGKMLRAPVEKAKPIVEENDMTDGSVDDYTIFDFYDHVEDWKKRIHPTIRKIDDITRKCNKIIQRPTSIHDVPIKDNKSISNDSLKQTIKNNDVTSSAHYLSNIDKYIDTTGESHTFLSKAVHYSKTDDDGVENDNTFLKGYDTQVIENKGEDKIISSPEVSIENNRTLLTPSEAFLKTGYIRNAHDELKVKTYFIQQNDNFEK